MGADRPEHPARDRRHPGSPARSGLARAGRRARPRCPGTHVTVLLPRRGFAPALGRLLHDRTADKIAAVISRVPNAAATIVPFDTSRPDTRVMLRGEPGQRLRRSKRRTARRRNGARAGARSTGARSSQAPHARPEPGARRRPRRPGRTPIGSLGSRQRAVVHGRIRSVRLQPLADSPMLVCEVVDSTGGLELLFYGRRSIPGMVHRRHRHRDRPDHEPPRHARDGQPPLRAQP